MNRCISAVVAALAVTGCSTKYPSEHQARTACRGWHLNGPESKTLVKTKKRVGPDHELWKGPKPPQRRGDDPWEQWDDAEYQRRKYERMILSSSYERNGQEVIVKTSEYTYRRWCEKEEETRQYIGFEDKRGTDGEFTEKSGGYTNQVKRHFRY